MFRSAIGRLAAFALLIAALAISFHLTISWSLKRVALGELGAFNQAMQGRVNADIVVSGSSRAFRHYDPRILTRETGLASFNLGRNASQIDVQLGVLKDYLRHNKKPRLVIQNLDLQSFVLTKPGEIFDPSPYVPYLNHPEIYAVLDRINGQLWKWKYIPLYVYATEDTSFSWLSGLMALGGLGPREPCFNGFGPVDKPWTRDFARFQQAHPQGIDIPIDRGAPEALEELIGLCKREGIELALVYSPQYHEMIGLTRNREQIFGLFTSIAQRHRVAFLDYTDSPISRTQELFYNAQHLNSRGAAVFSEDLPRQLVTRGLVSAAPAAVPARPPAAPVTP